MVSGKRTKFLIKKAFQLKYTGLILFFMLFTAILSSAAVYIAIVPFLSEKLASVYPQGRLSGVLRDANTKLFFSTALLLPIAAWFGITLSHRIAGPWYRLEVILRGMAEGSFTKDVTLRTGDELQSLASAINGVMKTLRDLSQRNLGYLQSMDEALRDFEVELKREPIDLMKVNLLFSKIQDISTDLKALRK